MPKPIVIKVDGSPLPTLGCPRVVARIICHLDSQPVDDVFTYRHLSNVLKYSVSHFYQHSSHPALSAYRTILQGHTYWGHPAAIAELKRQQGVEE